MFVLYLIYCRCSIKGPLVTIALLWRQSWWVLLCCTISIVWQASIQVMPDLRLLRIRVRLTILVQE